MTLSISIMLATYLSPPTEYSTTTPPHVLRLGLPMLMKPDFWVAQKTRTRISFNLYFSRFLMTAGLTTYFPRIHPAGIYLLKVYNRNTPMTSFWCLYS